MWVFKTNCRGYRVDVGGGLARVRSPGAFDDLVVSPCVGGMSIERPISLPRTGDVLIIFTRWCNLSPVAAL